MEHSRVAISEYSIPCGHGNATILKTLCIRCGRDGEGGQEPVGERAWGRWEAAKRWAEKKRKASAQVKAWAKKQQTVEGVEKQVAEEQMKRYAARAAEAEEQLKLHRSQEILAAKAAVNEVAVKENAAMPAEEKAAKTAAADGVMEKAKVKKAAKAAAKAAEAAEAAEGSGRMGRASSAATTTAAGALSLRSGKRAASFLKPAAASSAKSACSTPTTTSAGARSLPGGEFKDAKSKKLVAEVPCKNPSATCWATFN